MMDEDAAGLFPKMSEFQVIVDENVSGMAQELAFFAGAAGDDPDAGEVTGGPIDLLLFGPAAHGASGQDDGVEVRDRPVETHGVGHERQMAVEVFVVSDPVPESLGAERGLRLPWAHVEEALRRYVEVGEHAVAVKE